MAGAFPAKAIPADGTRFATALIAVARAQTKPSSGLFDKVSAYLLRSVPIVAENRRYKIYFL